MIGQQGYFNSPLNPPRRTSRSISPDRQPSLIRSLLNGVQIRNRIEIVQSGITLRHNESAYSDSVCRVDILSWR